MWVGLFVIRYFTPLLISYAKISANQSSGCLHWSLTADTLFQWSVQIIYLYINYVCLDLKKKH